jgi:MATE family multidrug resistance protein
MLAGYSIDSMNAAAISSNFAAIFTLMLIGLADSAEIFVGQYNGAKQYDNLATPIWQMIYMSFCASSFLIPIAYFSDYIHMLPLYYQKEGIIYQKVLMYFAMLPSIRVAFAAFFIGQGKTKIITFSIIIGSIINLILDYFFIYGLKMGCKGAAIATIMAEFIQILILAFIFFNSKNRKIYKTFEKRKFDKQLFKKIIKIGIPMSFGNLTAMVAWYIIQVLVSYISKDFATLYNIGVNVYILFIFAGEGLNKGIAVICANMIGRGDLASIEKTRKTFVYISLFFGFVISIPLIGFPESILKMFDMLPDNITTLYSDVRIIFAIVTINVILEMLVLSTMGILLSGGDSKYTMITYQACLWALLILPVMVLYFLNALNSVVQVYILMVLWLVASQFFIYKRYKSLKWYNKLV